MTKEELLQAWRISSSLESKIKEQLAENLRLQGRIIAELAWARIGKKHATLGELALATYDVKKELGLTQAFPREYAPQVYSDMYAPGNSLGIQN